MATQKVLLILGAGGNVGAATAKLFSQNGYKVAVAARKYKNEVNSEGQLEIQLDLAKPEQVDSAFDKVVEKFGAPNAVVYNASAVHFVSKENPFELSVDDYNADNAVNVSSALVAARRAVQAFDKLPATVPKTFIYTGNCTNNTSYNFVLPNFISASTGKSAAAVMMATGAKAYAAKGYHFYYADERTADGAPMYAKINGANHAEHYLGLAESTEQKPWLQTFVGGHGYKDFA